MSSATTLSKLVGELVGTSMLVMTVTCNVWGNTPFAVSSIGMSLMVGVYCLADVCGANFNPAVSLMLGVMGKLDWLNVLKYVLMQFIGGISGGLLGRELCSGLDLPALSPSLGKDTMTPLALGELLYTAFLCFTVLSVAVAKKNQPNNYYGLCIGLAVVAGGHASGKASGGLLNPAVALGIFIPEQIIPGVDKKVMGTEAACLGVAVVFELLGALLAVGMFYLVRPEEFSDGEEDNSEPGFLQRISAEVIGTFYLVCTLVSVIYSEDKIGQWPIAAALTCMLYSLGGVSGAHFNPVVTLALKLRGSVLAPGWAIYPLVQIISGILGACAARGLYPDADLPSFFGRGALVIPQEWKHASVAWHSLGAAVDAEMSFTCLLLFVVLSIATVDGKTVGDMSGLTVASCVTAAGCAVGRISGAHLNPAVTCAVLFATLVFHKGQVSAVVNFWLLGELLGCFIAVGLFKVLRPVKAAEEQALLSDGMRDDVGYSAQKQDLTPPAAAEAEAKPRTSLVPAAAEP